MSDLGLPAQRGVRAFRGPWRTRAGGIPPGTAFRWVFHAVLLAGAVVVLYAFSFPGLAFLPLVGAAVVLGVAALAWCVWVVQAARHRAWSRWLFVAPVGALIVGMLVATDVPLHARWTASRGAFDAQVRDLPPALTPGGQWVRVNVPSHLGLYDVTQALRVPGGVLFYEAHGTGFDDAGFAYLPDGPSPSLASGSFESPRFTHLGGPWYAWTASW